MLGKIIKPKERKQQKSILKLNTLKPERQLTNEQNMLNEMFNGNQTFGTGQNLPEINGILRSGHGLIKNDDNMETRKMFGFKRRI